MFNFNFNVNDTLRVRILIATFLLGIVFLIGIVGYHFIEGFSYFEGFYMTFITITTIGFGELTSLTVEGRILTIVISVLGIGIITYIASQTTQMLLELQVFKQRVIQNRINKMDQHYVICGYGRIGKRIATVLQDADLPIVIIEHSEDVLEDLNEAGIPYVNGNAQEESTLIQAGTNRAKALICTLSRDQDNVFVTLVARDLNPELFILVRTNQYKNIKKIYRAGADKVISPYEIGADRMANVILRPNVDAFMDKLYQDEREDHAFDEVKVMDGSPIAGKTLAEAGLRQTYMIVVIAIVHDKDDKMMFNPGGDQTLSLGDTLIVLGPPDSIERLRKTACRDDRSAMERSSDYKYLTQPSIQT